MTRDPDLLILGGGIIGLTAAVRLAQQGLRVIVLDKGAMGAEASWAGAGIIPPGHLEFAQTPLDQLRSFGSEQFPAWSQFLQQTTGIDNQYHRCGGIEFLTPSEADYLDRWQAERLKVETLRTLPPGLTAPGNTQAYHLPGFAQVRNPRHLQALIKACETLGVQLRQHCPATGWQFSLGGVQGVKLANGSVASASHYLIAAGAWAEEFLRSLRLNILVHPVRGQILLFGPSSASFRQVLLAGKRYIVPRLDGRVLVGSTEEPEAGFQKGNTESELASLKAFAYEMVPSLKSAPIEAAWSGLRPGSIDGLPTIDIHPEYANIHLAVGHFRAGVQLSLGTAHLLESLILGHSSVISQAGFRITRQPIQSAKPAFRS